MTNLTNKQQQNIESARNNYSNSYLGMASYGGEDIFFKVDDGTHSRIYLGETEKEINQKFEQSLLVDGFSKIEAKKFVEKYELIDHQINTKSGYAGSIFQDRETKEIHFTPRGTEASLQDWVPTDVNQIVKRGIAYDQSIDAYNHYMAAATPKDQQAPQFEVIDLRALAHEQAHDSVINKNNDIHYPQRLMEEAARIEQKLIAEHEGSFQTSGLLNQGFIIQGKAPTTGLRVINSNYFYASN